jgi:hypothetical protein
MHNAEEFSGQRSGFRRVLPTYRRAGAGAFGRGPGRIRYAHGGQPPRVEPFCTVPQAPAHHGGAADAPGTADAVSTADAAGTAGDGGVTHGGPLDTGAWLAELPAGGRHSDLWVLVCGGIAAAAAFAAAFVASGGMASHPAAPGATMPTVVSQACPSPMPGIAPKG